MATQLSIYNEALTQHLKERKLASLNEGREPRRVLDDIWDSGARKFCLEQGDWRFAQRVVKLTYDPEIAPPFGLNRVFAKPADLVRVSAFCIDERLDIPLLTYQEDANNWYAELDEIYVSYVSSDPAYGYDMSRWPESFVRYVAAYMAYMACGRITGNNVDKNDLKNTLKEFRDSARSKDALQGPTKFLPPGSWVTARLGGNHPSGRNSRSSLYGN